ncbi:MAG: GNAT family N-acetyltransferase [Deltaproteobacteria bacterium]|nr:GNAT family N-acetyltransferase [Deltaproteobacteria bacterium]MDZ4343310.1 GNAT family N-acetyltransferase [Candidatus Binatia bacterium]
MTISATIPGFVIRAAAESDVPVILSFIKKLAAYEKLTHEVVATETLLRETLFGSLRTAEVAIGYCEGKPVGFVLFFHNYSTFLGRPGLYIEDLFVDQAHRRRGFGRALLLYVAQLAKERRCGRLEWSVLDWNEPAVNFYRKLGAVAMNEWTVFRVTGASLTNLAEA